MDEFLEIFRKLNKDLQKQANHGRFDFSDLLLLWFPEFSSSESNFMESSCFLVVDHWRRLNFLKNFIQTFILKQIGIILNISARCSRGFLNYLGAKHSL